MTHDWLNALIPWRVPVSRVLPNTVIRAYCLPTASRMFLLGYAAIGGSLRPIASLSTFPPAVILRGIRSTGARAGFRLGNAASRVVATVRYFLPFTPSRLSTTDPPGTNYANAHRTAIMLNRIENNLMMGPAKSTFDPMLSVALTTTCLRGSR